MSFVLLICIVTISGCHSLYPINVIVTGDDLSDKKIDLLVKLKSEFFYTNNTDVSLSSQPLIVVDSNSEISEYNVDGYRSMLFHYLVENYKIEPNGYGKMVAKLYLNGKNEFKQLCENCDSVKVAVIDNNGKILQVSDEFKLDLRDDITAKDIEYDYSKNTVKPLYDYKRPFLINLLESLFQIYMNVMPLLSIMILCIFIVKKMRKELPSIKPIHALLSFAPCIPMSGYFI